MNENCFIQVLVNERTVLINNALYNQAEHSMLTALPDANDTRSRRGRVNEEHCSLTSLNYELKILDSQS